MAVIPVGRVVEHERAGCRTHDDPTGDTDTDRADEAHVEQPPDANDRPEQPECDGGRIDHADRGPPLEAIPHAVADDADHGERDQPRFDQTPLEHPDTGTQPVGCPRGHSRVLGGVGLAHLRGLSVRPGFRLYKCVACRYGIKFDFQLTVLISPA